MKKRILASILAAFMTIAFFTACDDSSDVGNLGDDKRGSSSRSSDSASSDQSTYDDSTQPTTNSKNANDSKNEIVLETYQNNDFSILVPQGWNLETGGDGVYFYYTISNPNDDSMVAFRYGKLEPILKSEEARASWQKWGPITGNGTGGEYFGKAPVCLEKTAKGMLDSWNEFVDYQKLLGQTTTFVPLYDINVKSCDQRQSALSSAGIPETIAVADCKTASGKSAQIALSTAISDPGYMDLFSEGIDTYYMSAYETTGILLPDNCSEGIAKALAQCVASLQFSDEFLNRAKQQGEAMLYDVQTRSAQNEALMDDFMRKWGY